jgi:hypothetical protein
MLLRYDRLARRSGQGCFSTKPARAGPQASRRVRSLLEEALGRAVNPPGSTAPARGWARARRDRVPGVDGALTCIAPIRPLQLVLMVVTSRV